MERGIGQSMARNRETWIDSVKVFACLMVVAGHLLQGLDAAAIFPDHTLFVWINKSIYAFHVQLFFICSGYLYQRFGRVRDLDSWKSNMVKKLLDLGVPYVSFTVVVWIIKKVIPGAGTNEIASLWKNLLLEPIPPYWYLYVLMVCFAVTPTFRSFKAVFTAYMLSVAMFAGRVLLPESTTPGVIREFVSRYMWFLTGMGFAMVKPEFIPKKKWIPSVLAGCYFVMICFLKNSESNIAWFFCSLMACSAVILYCYGREKQGRIVPFLTSYTMPIFLMHSVCIAVCRSVLIKCGITNLWLHILVGVACSIGCPIVAAEIMKKLKYPEFFLYPRKFIKLKK